MTDATSNPQSGLDWEDLCLDPHHYSLQQGKIEGREAGALAGFRDGQQLGQTKGLEFGLEVGFYQGAISALRHGREWNERIQHSIDKVQDAINDFPNPDQVFATTRQHTSNENSLSSWIHSSNNSSTLDNHDDHDSEEVAKLDILHKLQRIRARFKLLMVQLGKPHFSLQHALEPPSSQGQQSTDDDEW